MISSVPSQDSLLLDNLVKKHGVEKISYEVKRRTLSLHKLLQVILCTEPFSNRFFSFLSLAEISLFDSATTSHAIRSTWLECPKILRKQEIKLHRDKEVEWCLSRGIYFGNLSIAKNCRISHQGFRSLCADNTKYLKQFHLEYEENIDDIIVDLLVKSTPLLEGLELIYNNFQDDGYDYDIDSKQLPSFKLFTSVGKNCPLLESLQLRFVILSSEGIAALTSGCKKLKAIELQSTPGINNSLLQVVGNDCRSLESFQIYESDETTNEGLKYIIKGCPMLKMIELNAQLPSVTDDAFINLSTHCPQLEKITMYLHSTTNTTLAELGKLKQLKEINLYCNYHITDEGIQGLVGGLFIGNSFSSLEHIKIGGGKTIKITNKGVKAILKQCRQLKSFEIHTNRITDDAFTNIAQLCPLLEDVSVTFKKITNATFIEVGKLKKLKRFNFEYSDMITDKGIISLVTPNGPTKSGKLSKSSLLESFHLKIDGERITNASIYTIANGCPNLNYLEINDVNKKVSVKSIKYLVDKCKLLTRLSDLYFEVPVDVKRELRRRQLGYDDASMNDDKFDQTSWCVMF